MKTSIAVFFILITSFANAQNNGNVSSSSYALDIFSQEGSIVLYVGSTAYIVTKRKDDNNDSAIFASQCAIKLGISSQYKYQFFKGKDCVTVKYELAAFSTSCHDFSNPSNPVANKLNGYGKQYYTNDVYEGNFNNGKYNGFGKYTWKDGSYYEGNFTNGEFTGIAKKVEADGRV